MLSLRPTFDAFRRLLGAPSVDLTSEAFERWEISPSFKRPVRAAIHLPGQIERIRGSEFATIPELIQNLKGGFDGVEDATMGYRIRHVDLVDGVLYGSRGLMHLRQRQHALPAYSRPSETLNGALYESWIGNRWFGSWLLQDCLTYQLAQNHGVPVTTAKRSIQGHVPQYERILGMQPRRIADAHFDELTIFRDGPHSEDKRLRAEKLRSLLTSTHDCTEHPGVFMLRGSSGDRRILLNEVQLAEHLAHRWGFRVVDPMKLSLDAIVAACAGARVVAGIEGSHLVHGLIVMPPKAALLVIQPPYRTECVLKWSTDRQGQNFAFVVASGTHDEFMVDLDEIDRTLHLILAAR